jgi:hypothetical protein
MFMVAKRYVWIRYYRVSRSFQLRLQFGHARRSLNRFVVFGQEHVSIRVFFSLSDFAFGRSISVFVVFF